MHVIFGFSLWKESSLFWRNSVTVFSLYKDCLTSSFGSEHANYVDP